jgi:hypothetical protein
VPVPDDTRPQPGTSIPHLSPSVVARCEGCGLVYEVDVLGASAGDQVAECGDCGSPIYVIAAGDDDVYLAGFGAGWDACAAFVTSAATGAQLDELTSGTEWAARLAEGE